MAKRRAKKATEDSIEAKRLRLRADTVGGLIASVERHQSTLEALTLQWNSAKGLPADQAEDSVEALKREVSELWREANQTLDSFERLGSINTPRQMNAALDVNRCIGAAANLLVDIDRELLAIANARRPDRQLESGPDRQRPANRKPRNRARNKPTIPSAIKEWSRASKSRAKAVQTGTILGNPVLLHELCEFVCDRLPSDILPKSIKNALRQFSNGQREL